MLRLEQVVQAFPSTCRIMVEVALTI